MKEENDALREELGRLRIDHHRTQVEQAWPALLALIGMSPCTCAHCLSLILQIYLKLLLWPACLPDSHLMGLFVQVRYDRVAGELQKLRGSNGQVSGMECRWREGWNGSFSED